MRCCVSLLHLFVEGSASTRQLSSTTARTHTYIHRCVETMGGQRARQLFRQTYRHKCSGRARLTWGRARLTWSRARLTWGRARLTWSRFRLTWGRARLTWGAWELTHVQRYTDIGGHLECESQPVTSPANQHHMSHANLSIYIDTCAHINTYIHAFINCLETRGGQRLRANSTSVAESLCIPAPCHLSPGPRQPIPAPNQPAPAPNQPSPAPSQLRPAPNQLCSDLE